MRSISLAVAVVGAFLLFETSALAQGQPIHPEAPTAPDAPGPDAPAPDAPGLPDSPDGMPAPPPAPAPAPAPRVAPAPVPHPAGYGQQRCPGGYSRGCTSWYIGFGVGGGAGWVSDDSGWTSDKEGGIAILFKAGLVLSPQWLVGIDISAWRYQNEQDNAVQFNHYDAVATLYPFWNLGLYLKGGLGFGLAVVQRGNRTSTSEEAGLDLKLGAGWDIQIGRSFNMGFDLTQASTKYDGGWTHDFTANVTFSWF